MKNTSILVLLVAFIGLFALNSCDDIQDGNEFTFLSAGEIDFSVILNTTGSLDVTIYSNDISTLDRTFNLKVSEESTALASDYTVPNSFTIPANANEAVIAITAKDVTSKLVLEIEDPDENVFTEDIIINILKVCPLDRDTFAGDATVLEEAWVDYDPEDIIRVEAGTNENEFFIFSANKSYIANRDETYLILTVDPETSVATAISKEPYQYSFGNLEITGEGTADPCTKTINLTMKHTRVSDNAMWANRSLIIQLP
ncbi:hypothetical protein [Flagellimonas onchidii]|uniref:hypothetical protein n=1 Tax=Flagellimonas onchidii TaxID=2562684 RepID=UPI0010A6338B|nr:hypothetical protein [Allomuricauda onchidii]